MSQEDWKYQDRRAKLTRFLEGCVRFVQGLDQQSGDPLMTRLDAIQVVRSYQERVFARFEGKWNPQTLRLWRTLVYEILDEFAREKSN